MEASQIQHALVQVLENYRRCGVSHAPRLPIESIPAGWIDALTEMPKSAGELTSQPSAGAGRGKPEETAASGSSRAPEMRAAAVASVESEKTPNPATAIGDLTSELLAARTPAGAFSSEGANTAGLPWSLPVLPDAEKRRQFETLNTEIEGCRRCADICSFRQRTVFGVGPLSPTVCFMGEAPGADEDRTGEPFVGKAGQLLTKIIAAMKLKREEVYILNALKCRPPQNRTPMPEEIDNCRNYAETQLNVLQPKYIVCLGAVAVRSLLREDLSIGRLRGRFHRYRDARVVVTYHPSYLLRNESAKRLVWEDMQMLMREMGLK